MQSTCILNMYTYDMYLQVSGEGAVKLTLTSLREIMEYQIQRAPALQIRGGA